MTAIAMSRLVLLIVLLLPAVAAAHDGYTGLMQPGRGVSCCDQTDCRPVKACRIEGEDGVILDGICERVPRDKIIEAPHLPGVHACWKRYPGTLLIFCVKIDTLT